MSRPRVSIVLPAMNAAAIIDGTLDSLRAQRFRDFEIVAVDGASTDGTAEKLRAAAADLPIKLVSERDRSVADALAKGLARASGDILGILCADERYYPDTLAQAVAWFEAEPEAVVCTGRLDFMDERENAVGSFPAQAFDLAAHLSCELVPSILASFFNRKTLGAELRYDAEIATCPDYELWARLGILYPAERFKRVDASVGKTFTNSVSMSFRPESFVAFTRDKLAHLDRLVNRFLPAESREMVRRHAASGIYLWAAEQLLMLDPCHPDILKYAQEAARLDPAYPRIQRLVAQYGRAAYDPDSATITRLFPDRPRDDARPVDTKITIMFDRNRFSPIATAPLTLRTADADWDYSYTIRVQPPETGPVAGQPWLALDLEVTEGAVGIGLMRGREICAERVLRREHGRTRLIVPLGRDLPQSVMLRSGGIARSVFRVHGFQMLVDPAA